MDCPAVTQIFRRLFAQPARDCLRQKVRALPRLALPRCQRRYYALRRKGDDEHGGSRWQQRIDAFPRDMSKQLKEYPRVTSTDLRHRTQRPRRVKMLTRDFIEGWSILETACNANDSKTVCTIRTTATSPNMLLFST